MDKKENLLLINSLPGPRFKMGYIPGSVNIPDGLFAKMTEKLPKDKSKTLIFYCLGPKCIFSFNSAKKATKLGYTDVYVYREGIPAWSKKGFPIKVELKLKKTPMKYITMDKVKDKYNDYYIIDVMYDDHFKKYNFINSINIPLDFIEQKHSSFPKDKTILIIDHSNKLDKIGWWLLSKAGFTNVVGLKGGKLGWLKNGYPFSKK
jgi:rhodanese-related sulfurtransferase